MAALARAKNLPPTFRSWIGRCFVPTEPSRKTRARSSRRVILSRFADRFQRTLRACLDKTSEQQWRADTAAQVAGGVKDRNREGSKLYGKISLTVKYVEPAADDAMKEIMENDTLWPIALASLCRKFMARIMSSAPDAEYLAHIICRLGHIFETYGRAIMISVIQIFVYPNAWPDHVLWGSVLIFLLTVGQADSRWTI
jgi:hypothetical protein